MEVAESQKILLPGDLIGNYRIDNFLGQGGFGITYLAHDTMLDIKVAIKEYLPEKIVQRLSQHTVRPRSSEDAVVFRKGLDNFLKEARTLARFEHPNIVGVKSVFEHGGTAYMVMAYEQGRNLKHLFDKRKHTTEPALKSIVAPLLDGLNEVHRHGFIHRDIKPANIIMRNDGSPVLLDFGSARLAGEGFSSDLTAMVTAGFAPLEQYSGLDEQQGPWSDIYALGAVLYYAVTGSTPEDSTVRGASLLNGRPDPLKTLYDLAPKGYSRAFCEAIDWALAFRVSARPQTLTQWRGRLLDGQLHDKTEELRHPVDLDRYKHTSSGFTNRQGQTAPEMQRRFPSTSRGDDVTVIAPSTSLSRRENQPVDTDALTPVGRPRLRRRGIGSRFLPNINHRFIATLGLLVTFVLLAVFFGQQRGDLQVRELASQKDFPTFTDQSSGLVGIQNDQAVSEDTSDSTSAVDANVLNESENTSSAYVVNVNIPQKGAVAAQDTVVTVLPEPTKPEVKEAERVPLTEESAAEIEDQRAAVLRAAEQRAATQRQAQRKRALEQARRDELERQRLASAQSESEGLVAELASERSSVKPAITDTDMFIVLTRFNSLSSAIKVGNSDEIKELTITSERKNRFFDNLFRTFETVDVSIKNITASRWDQKIRATLSINKMTRRNGDTAFAPEEFKNIPIHSVREDTWSAIHW